MFVRFTHAVNYIWFWELIYGSEKHEPSIFNLVEFQKNLFTEYYAISEQTTQLKSNIQLICKQHDIQTHEKSIEKQTNHWLN
jgi:hypothetical protein